jgi:hypothetical protein
VWDRFKTIWLIDFEFRAPDGERPAVRCLVAHELRGGREVRLWLNGRPAPPAPPFGTGPDALVVAYFATAEMGCFLSLGWRLPVNLLDLYVEFKRHVCGKDGEPGKPSLVYALDYFGLASIDAAAKKDLRELAMREGPYTDAERAALLDYCASDVHALARLLPKMVPLIDLPRAVLRGGFVKAIAHAEHNGTPIDVPTLRLLDRHWEDIQDQMVREVDADYGVYEGIHFRADRFARYLLRHGMQWPRLPSGELALDDDSFADMCKTYPVLRPLRQLRQAMGKLRLTDLAVGSDDRNRCLLSPFGTSTGRCAPSTSRFIFTQPAWLRSLILPEAGTVLAYADWASQEYGIGAVLSGDAAMIADYQAGDPYIAFAKRIGLAPPWATKNTHRAERDLVKVVILGLGYGMGEEALAARIGKSKAHARALLQAHRSTYRRFWRWSDGAVNLALFRGKLHSRYGWQVHAGRDPNVRSLANFPCQAGAADMLRLAAELVVNAGVKLCATVHDAVLVEAPAGDAAVSATRAAMARASALVLDGFELRTDVEVIAHPNRYRDRRGADFFDRMLAMVSGGRDPGHFVPGGGSLLSHPSNSF